MKTNRGIREGVAAEVAEVRGDTSFGGSMANPPG